MTRKQETKRGLTESAASVEVLRSLWPAAFPKRNDLVRPLARGLIPAIAEGTGWSPAYAQGVVEGWKRRVAYCKAVLTFDRRWNLNGEKTDDTVTDEARELARQRLERYARRAVEG
jgi:ProQ/FINO family